MLRYIIFFIFAFGYKSALSVQQQGQAEINSMAIYNDAAGKSANEKYAPWFINHRLLYREENAPSGSNVQFTCSAEGNPKPNITWYKNDELVPHLPLDSYAKWFFLLEDVVKSDAGNYTCKVCNEMGCIQDTFKLRVQDRYPAKPFIKDGFPGNHTAFVNDTVQFHCPVISDLKPYVFWRWLWPNGTEEILDISDIDNPDNSLTLFNVTTAQEGWYSCIAVNSIGNSTASGYLKVVNEVVNNDLNSSSYVIPKTILLTVIGLLILVIAITIIVTRVKMTKMKKQAEETTRELIAERWIKMIKVENLDNNTLIMPTVSIEKVRYQDLSKVSQDQGTLSEYILPVDTTWEVPKEYLSIGKILGEGEFGKVVKAECTDTVNSTLPCTVAVKMLKEGHSDGDMIALVSEMEIMKIIGKHENIINLLGCCTQDGPLYIIVEYASNGCLKDFLKKHNPDKRTGSTEDLSNKPPTPRNLVDFALQVAKGMEHLASRGCIHRDLAARNVLVSGERVMKVADFGLARDVRDSDYYRKKTAGKLPIKWMAPESIAYNFYTTQSDVWSFGVLTWEIMTFARTPYPHVPAHCVYDYLKSGRRMEKPTGCCQRMYSLMLRCWSLKPDHRPSFSNLVGDLQEILNDYDSFNSE